MKYASLAEIRRAVESAAAYLELESVSLQEAVDVACDHEQIVSDSDRRIVRNGVRRRMERAAGKRRRVG